MYIKDSFTKGLLAGTIAGIVTKPYDLLAYYLGFSTLHWYEVSGVFIFGKKPTNFLEAAFATVSTWFFHALLGIVFVYLIQRIFSNDNLMLKSWFFGVAWWFVIYAIIMLFGVPQLSFVPLKTSLSNFVGASIWGLSLGIALRRLDKVSRLDKAE